jgi:hypothetical protein
MKDEKHFDEWNELKKSIHAKCNISVFHEREIWWYAAGKNIGAEVKWQRPAILAPNPNCEKIR